MKVLVTGANGLLGSHIIRTLEKKGYNTVAFVRKGSNLEALKSTSCEIAYGNITNPQQIEKALNNCDFVIHAAASTAQTSALEPFIQPNINATKYLAEACQKRQIKRFVFVSTANCFGNGNKQNPGTENKPFLPWLKKSGYAYSKFLAQQYVLQQANSHQLNAVVVNPTFIIGENDTKPSSGKIFSHVLNKKIVFYPPGGKNFVSAEMAAQGVVGAMEKGKNGECYLLAGENLSYFEFFKMVKSIEKQKTILLPIPGFVLKFLGLISGFTGAVLKIPVSLNQTNSKMLCIENYYSATKAENELNFKIIPIQKSVEKTILWFKKHNYLK